MYVSYLILQPQLIHDKQSNKANAAFIEQILHVQEVKVGTRVVESVSKGVWFLVTPRVGVGVRYFCPTPEV